MMQRTPIVAVAAALAASALALGSCSSDPLKGCSFAHLDIYPPFGLFVAVGDSTTVSAQVTSDCSAIGNAVDFSLKSPALATVRATSPTAALLRGVAVGTTMLYVTPRDYPQNRDSVELQVIGPNP